jgi:threonine/homoserine/homoserine lactone efflux protein
MPDTGTLLAFSAAALVFFVVPGPAVLYIVTRSVTQGRAAGFASVAGIHTGSLVHIAAAVAGLTTLLATSTAAFRAVKWAGAAYLIYLGIRTLVERPENDELDTAAPPASLARVYRQGFVVNLLNPKMAAFFLAFVPHFIDPAQSSTTQLLILGALFVVLGVLSDGTYVLITGSLGTLLQQRHWWRHGRRLVAGSIYLTLGALAAAGAVTTESD